MCDLNPDWLVQMITEHLQSLERIELLLEKLVELQEGREHVIDPLIRIQLPEETHE